MSKKKAPVVADICLYGSSFNADYIAVACDGRMFGDGEPSGHLSLTSAMWLACSDLDNAGYEGMVRVFAPGGEKMAVCSLKHPPYFGSLEWGPAPVYEISAEEIMAAAEGK